MNIWQLKPEQFAWRTICYLFLIFYFGEAILFWNGLGIARPLMDLPLAVPIIYPLGYWGAFAYMIFRFNKVPNASRFEKIRSVILAIGIGLGVIAITVMIMRASGQTIGHVVLFALLYMAALSIGAMEINIGWIVAAVIWLGTAIIIYAFARDLDIIPLIRDEDVIVGLGAALGFAAIGFLPFKLDQSPMC